jgi:hypothetical protein
VRPVHQVIPEYKKELKTVDERAVKEVLLKNVIKEVVCLEGRKQARKFLQK